MNLGMTRMHETLIHSVAPFLLEFEVEVEGRGGRLQEVDRGQGGQGRENQLSRAASSWIRSTSSISIVFTGGVEFVSELMCKEATSGFGFTNSQVQL